MANNTTRASIVSASDTIVVKVGTRVLTRSDGVLDLARIASLSGQLAEVVQSGRQVVLVSSGAVGAGIGRLKLAHRPSDLAELQAVASVGQSCLIEAYNHALEVHGLHAAQVLLTADDFGDRARYLNVRNTLFALFELGAVPIVNENDAVRVEELQRNVGDNDRLAALVTNLLRAPLLVLLSDVEGVYDLNSGASSERPVIREIDLSAADAGGLVGPIAVTKGGSLGPQLSVGGMRNKLEAARMVAAAGEQVIIASGHREHVLRDILAGEEVGTLVLGAPATVNSRKRWIGGAARCAGQLVVDEGAVRALCERGGSLLAVGVAKVEGDFAKGDVVSIASPAGQEIARGLTNYTADEVRQIAGESTERFAELLGYCPYIEVVHRDNLALTTN